ncbi:lipocalin family protein [Mucilaginibacter sp. SP1R1]|uniref:lipocalin family protein n=1 Tax=Mucilaginibacter sp. SP1R1 TaxID=2723091 RepID=UPI00160D084B|nr:lipocalin family protein [Mucilaginibacter sp. SP1R1]MBB6152473.1 hypothetical protein [Mucilaginibacter sp. SP1R1]
MKRLLNLTTAFGFFSCVLLLAFAACKKESSAGLNINGKWATVGAPKLTVHYEFKADQTFEASVTGIDSATQKPVGILSKTTGKYTLKNSQLNLYDIVSYANKNYTFGAVSELMVTDGPKTLNYSVTLNDKANMLSLLFICGPADDCTPSHLVYYYKQ